ncbi:DEAD/DEAH box helicase [Herbiconiux liukaitaii]|uniref:DEAD/DEAH box helicase n=1 Tax=Herbiconiux liukaitaii TaxID=3342799 RepID=UPI0035B98EDF
MRFEKLMVAYLKADPTYQQIYSDVWMWTDYPARNGRIDNGIDLVAQSRDTGEMTAIQCKFYAPNHPLNKPDIDSFLSASSKTEFTGRMIISTTDNWGKNAEDAVEGQNPPVLRLRVQDLDDSPIDWSLYTIAKPSEIVLKAAKQAFPHQEAAITEVLAGFENADRGKLIMACGTGKTFTSLKLMERVVPKGGTVLFLVPSISLLSQTLKEWTSETADAAENLRSFAVCSDVSVGKRKSDEDIPLTDLAYPATTNAKKLMEKMSQVPVSFNGRTVIFSTYQSIDVLSKAQDEGLPEFDLIICDEAHRTTGVKLAGDEDASVFTRVHNQSYIKAKKRLYMTATPRIYADSARTKAEEVGAEVNDMNNVAMYGEEFHRLSFGQAVEMGRLSDYKVLILAVDESYISSRFQRMLADDDNSMKLEDAAKIVGCWNGLSKRSLTPEEFDEDPLPMKRAVAFARNIAESKKIAGMFASVVEAEIDALDEDSGDLLHTEVEHVDGTFNVLKRNAKLDWLKEDGGENVARILTNAKCLSEGVDVPALDAVMFLNPRESVVDVVQSVGRVMRKLDGKNYGYVILPIAVPTDMDPATALNDNKKYKVVWQVLQALRAHDERFDAMVNKIDLTGSTEGKINVIGVGGRGGGDDEKDYGNVTLDFPNIDKWRDAILSKIVQKVGERRYWENWASDVAGIAEAHMTRIKTLVDDSDAELHDEFTDFVKGLKDNLNPFITEKDAIEMLSQHLITKPVFDALFEGYSFSEHNPVSLVMQKMADALEGQNLEKETEQLNAFYDSVRKRASGITDAAAKQSIVKELYEKFFKTAFSGTSDRLGIVYTPNEVVDFIIHSVDDALGTEFGTSLTEKGVHILDPFTGTGTFIVRLLQSGLIQPDDLAYKYRHELHANEIVLLAYYVAAINIEETYHDLTSGEYTPFEGIVLTDTFQMHEDDDELDSNGVFPENNERVKAQKAQDIRVIIGNPPYSVGQSSENDNNKNLSYPTLDKKIEATYARRANAGLKKSLYDSYIRAIRWASDRIGDHGIVAYVSNGGFIDSNSADGLRKTLVEEFSSIYAFNLRGNALGSGDERRRESGNVFGAGTRTTVAIYLLIKNPNDQNPGKIFYRDIGDNLSREQKLETIRTAATYQNVDWQSVVPNDAGDWINQRNEDFETLTPFTLKSGERGIAVLGMSSFGVVTNRDSWVYSYSRAGLDKNVKRLVSNYNLAVDRLQGSPDDFDAITSSARSEVSWTRALKNDLGKGKLAKFDAAEVVSGAYRPFSRQWIYFDKQFNEMQYQIPKLFPSGQVENYGFVVTSPSTHLPTFEVLMVRGVPDLHLLDTGHFYPRYRFEKRDPSGDLLDALDDDGSEFRKIDNVTDEILADYRKTFGNDVSKDDIFFYLYGILHSPDYRSRFGSDLKKMLPRLPKVKDFQVFSDSGRTLSGLHLDYESANRYPLDEARRANATDRVEKMRYGKVGKKVDKTTILYNSGVTIKGIPEEAHGYMLGSRSAVDWIVERYQVKTDKPSGIVNDPNDWGEERGNPRYVLDLLARVVTVSVKTVEIVKSLPPLDVIEA